MDWPHRMFCRSTEPLGQCDDHPICHWKHGQWNPPFAAIGNAEEARKRLRYNSSASFILFAGDSAIRDLFYEVAASTSFTPDDGATRPGLPCKNVHAHQHPVFREPVSVPMVLQMAPDAAEAPPGRVDAGKGQHTRTPLRPAAPASVPYGIVLVRVRVRGEANGSNRGVTN